MKKAFVFAMIIIMAGSMTACSQKTHQPVNNQSEWGILFLGKNNYTMYIIDEQDGMKKTDRIYITEDAFYFIEKNSDEENTTEKHAVIEGENGYLFYPETREKTHIEKDKISETKNGMCNLISALDYLLYVNINVDKLIMFDNFAYDTEKQVYYASDPSGFSLSGEYDCTEVSVKISDGGLAAVSFVFEKENMGIAELNVYDFGTTSVLIPEYVTQAGYTD